MNIKPIGPRVLIAPLPVKTTSEGGIHLPEEARESSHEFIVVAVGTGSPSSDGMCTRPIVDVAIGDRVVCSKYSGTELKVDGKEMRVVDVDSIIAVLTPDPLQAS